MKFFVALLACSFLMLFSMAGVNAVENNTTDGTVINDINVLEEENNPLQSSDTDSTGNDTEDQTDTATYQASAEDPPINSVSIEEVETASVFLSDYVTSHNTLPETIQVGSYTLTMAQFLKVLLTTTIHLDQGITDSINIDAVGDAPNPAGNVNYGNILKSEYLRNAINILYFMDSYGRAPNYWGTSLGNLRFEGLVLSYANIMDFYEGNDRLPNYTKISPSDYMGLVTVEEVEAASVFLSDYVTSHNTLPETIQVGSYTLTMAQFLKVLLYTTLQLDQGNHNPIKISVVNNASNPAGNVNYGNILKSEYLRNAINILYFMDSYGRAPNYWGTSLGNLRFEGLVLSYANIMDFYEGNDRLPNYTKISPSDYMGLVTVEEVEMASAYLKDYVEANKALPATIRVGSYTLTMPQFLKVLLYTTLQLDQGNHNPIKISAVNNASNPSDINVSGNILKSEYLRNAINILYFMKDYGRAPNYWLTSLGNLRYEAIVLSYAKIIDFHEYYNRLPNYIKISRYDFNNYNNVHGIWIQSASVYTLEVSELIKMDITDVFVICKRTGSNIYSTILPILLNKLQGTSIRVHAWIICFHDDNGFIDPSSETYQQDLINYISLLMNNYNIDGVHLDYVRYPGDAYNHNGTEVITNFVEDVYNRVKSINNGLAVSAALMPEKEFNAYYYGQDYGLLAPYLDFMVPMIYKYEYTPTTAWIASTTQYIVGQAGDTPVVAGLQTYNDDYEPIFPAELRNDINVAVTNGSCGFALFRYGLIHEDFTY